MNNSIIELNTSFFLSYIHRLYVITWNVGTAEPPEDVDSLLQLSSPKKPDLYVIG